MNATMTTSGTKVLLLAGVGIAVVCSANPVKADRVRVAASLPGVSFDVGPRHAAVSLGRDGRCRSEPRQVWHEPVYEWREVWVEVPAVVETRRVAEYGHCGRIIGYRYVEVVVEPARRELRRERILVLEGYYETVYERTCDDRGYEYGVGVGYDDGYDHDHFVIDKRPNVVTVVRPVVRPVNRFSRAVRVAQPARPHGHVHVRVRR